MGVSRRVAARREEGSVGGVRHGRAVNEEGRRGQVSRRVHLRWRSFPRVLHRIRADVAHEDGRDGEGPAGGSGHGDHAGRRCGNSRRCGPRREALIRRRRCVAECRERARGHVCHGLQEGGERRVPRRARRGRRKDGAVAAGFDELHAERAASAGVRRGRQRHAGVEVEEKSRRRRRGARQQQERPAEVRSVAIDNRPRRSRAAGEGGARLHWPSRCEDARCGRLGRESSVRLPFFGDEEGALAEKSQEGEHAPTRLGGVVAENLRGAPQALRGPEANTVEEDRLEVGADIAGLHPEQALEAALEPLERVDVGHGPWRRPVAVRECCPLQAREGRAHFRHERQRTPRRGRVDVEVARHGREAHAVHVCEVEADLGGQRR